VPASKEEPQIIFPFSFEYGGLRRIVQPGKGIHLLFFAFAGCTAELSDYLRVIAGGKPKGKDVLRNLVRGDDPADRVKDVLNDLIARDMQEDDKASLLVAVKNLSPDWLIKLVNLHLPEPSTEPTQRFLQPTFEEVRNVGAAIAHGRNLQHWKEMAESATAHFGGDRLRVSFELSTKSDDRPTELANLREALGTFNQDATICYFLSVELAIRSGLVSITFDQMIKKLGWSPRNAADRHSMYKRLWSWFWIYHSLVLVGERARRSYHDPETKKPIEFSIQEPLLRVKNFIWHNFGDDLTPIGVVFVPGNWLEEKRHNRGVLPYSGDLGELVKIPSGQPSGAWARSIGMALVQLWRENLRRATVGPHGLIFPPFKRRNLLELYPPEPSSNDVLNGNHPMRALKYFDSAIKSLTKHRVIRDPEKLSVPKTRQGWADAWLEDEICLQPGRLLHQELIKVTLGTVRYEKRASESKRRKPLDRKNLAE
jgi:hypothetical protein